MNIDKAQASVEVLCRVRDFSRWTASGSPLARDWQLSKNIIATEAHAAELQRMFPIVKRQDPASWHPGGFKRVELDAALTVLGFPPLED